MFWRSGFATISFTAWAGPISCGASWVPPQPGMIPRKTSGKPKWRTEVEIVRAEQCSEISSPPPRQAPLIAATVGYGSVRMRAKRSCPARLPSIAVSRSRTFGNSVMSAPAAKTNGFPVSTIATQSPDSSSPSTRCPDSSAPREKTVGFV